MQYTHNAWQINYNYNDSCVKSKMTDVVFELKRLYWPRVTLYSPLVRMRQSKQWLRHNFRNV